jgi:hypothetical protein
LATWIVPAIAALPIVRANELGKPNGDGKQSPVYQRQAFDWKQKRIDRRRHSRPFTPPVSADWFQRPYPYHHDYYKMRYGGSYAPYFGNLYGPPQVVTAPPYYGPYYGDYVSPNGSGYFDGPYANQAPGEAMPGGVVYERSGPRVGPMRQPISPPNGEILPPPAP